MPDLALSTKSLKSQNFITPRIGVTPGTSLTSTLTSDDPANLARQSQMTENLFRSKFDEDPNENFATRTGKYLAAAGVDIVDMVGSAVTPLERGDVWNEAREWGMDSLANFAQRNKSGVELTSGIVTAVVTAGLADAYLVPALGAKLASSTFLSSTKLWKSGERILGNAKMLATNSAQAAAINGELATLMGTSGGAALLRARMAKGFAGGVVQEAAVAAVTHTNTELWSEDTATNLMMMSLGIGIAGGLGAVGARYEMRSIANSDEILRLRQAASDPYGYAAIRQYNPNPDAAKNLAKNAEFKESATLTALLLSARQIAPSDLPANRVRLIEAEAKQVEIQAQQSMQKIATKGIPGVNNTSFNVSNGIKSSPEGRHLAAAGHDDPTVFMGIDSLGVGDIGKNIDSRAKHIEALKTSENIADIRLGRELESQESLGLINGSWMPDSKELRSIAKYRPNEVKVTPTSKTKGNFEIKIELSDSRFLTINEGGNIRNFENLEFDNQLRAYEGLNLVANKMIASKQEFVLPANPTWLQLDFANNFTLLGGKVDSKTYANLKDSDAISIASLRLKAQAAKSIVAKKGGLSHWDRAKLNLPLPNSLERIHDGSSDVMTRVLQAAEKSKDITVAELKQIRKDLLDAADLRTGIKTQDPAIHGDMFNFNRSKQTGEWQPIVTGFASFNRVQPGLEGTRHQLITATAENKIYRMEQLRRGVQTREITESLLNLPEFGPSQSILLLARDQITGAGGAFDQGAGTLLTRSMRYRESKSMSSTLNVREVVDRSTEEYTNRVIKDVFGDSQNKLAAATGKTSKVLVDQWFSYAGGWDLQQGVLRNADGMFVFALADTAKNANRLGRPVQAGDLLLNPNTNRVIGVDELALDYLERFQIAAGTVLKDSNAIRMSRGMNPIERKAWYVPPPATKGMIKGFTFDSAGNTVPGGAIVAKSQEEFDSMAKAKSIQLEKEGKGHRFRSEVEIRAADDLWELSDMGWVDPGFIGAKKTGQTGSIFSDRMNPRAMEESLEFVADKIGAVSNGTVRVLYDQQISIARARSAAEVAVGGADRRTIYDEWEATILGRPLSAIKAGAGTQVIKAAEELTQSLINSGWPLVSSVGSAQTKTWLTDMSHRMGMSSLKGFKSFDDLANQLGPYSPYKNTLEFLEANKRVSVPPEIASITNGINKFSASMLLRWMEFPHAIMNMIGIVTNMPSILRSPSTPMIGSMQTAKGKRVGVVDSYRLLAGGFVDMLSGARHVDWDVMVKNGDTSQSIAELNKTIALIDSQGTAKKILVGDKSKNYKPGIRPKNGKELKEWIQYKGVDGLISLAADTSESMSRSWAHFVGLRLADLNGIVGTEARHSFARNVANQSIANYNPLNKPELFQSSFGAMFGLFASYMQQYNQRLFRWVELGEYASVGRQLAMQSAMFGVASTPGYNAVESILQSAGIGPNDNPDATLTDAIYAKYGPKVGSVIAHGGVQELPKILGLIPGVGEIGGVALYSRGDANFRAPSLSPAQLMAGLNVVTNITEGIWEIGNKSVKALADEDTDMTGRFISETIAKHMPNRALKGTIQALFNDGQEIDSAGQIATQTQDWFESSLRLLGVRSSRQQGEIEAYYANSSMRRRLAGRMETLREETRTLMRSGKSYDPMEIFNKYVERGGSPTHFKGWIQDQMRATQDTRGMKKFVESLKSPNAQLEAWRYDTR